MHSGSKFTRGAEFDAAAADDDGRIPVVIASEHPVERDGFVEVLAHDSEASVDLRRAPLPLCVLHDHRKLPVGVVEDLRLDVAARVLRGMVRFAKTPEAQALLAQVRDKTLRWVSVGYVLLRELGRAGRVTRYAWAPHECSLVAVPADPGAQFFRSQSKLPRFEMSNENTTIQDRRAGDREAERLRQIIGIGENSGYKRYLRDGDVRDAVERGMSVDEFKEVILSRMGSGHTDTSEAHIGMTPREVERYSFGRAIAAAVTGDWTKAGLEREASRALERSFGRAPEGFFVPAEFWGRGRRDFNVGTATEAGNLVATDLRGDLFADALRNAMVLGPLGAKLLTGLTGNVDVPRKVTPGTLGMLTEIGSASETAPVTAKLSLTPKRIGAYTEYSKQALIQSAIGIEGLIRDDLVQGAAALIEYQAINGAGTGNEIRGIRNTTGIGTSTAGGNGATVAWQHFLDLESACANANATPGSLAGYLTNSKVKAKAKGVQRGTSLDFIIPGDVRAAADGSLTLNSYRAMFSNSIPSNLTKGTSTTICSSALFSSNWAELIVGLWAGPDITVDPYTLAATGQVRITLNQFVDAGARQPAAFAKIDDLLT